MDVFLAGVAVFQFVCVLGIAFQVQRMANVLEEISKALEAKK